jgi:hypothetical protein
MVKQWEIKSHTSSHYLMIYISLQYSKKKKKEQNSLLTSPFQSFPLFNIQFQYSQIIKLNFILQPFQFAQFSVQITFNEKKPWKGGFILNKKWCIFFVNIDWNNKTWIGNDYKAFITHKWNTYMFIFLTHELQFYVQTCNFIYDYFEYPFTTMSS